MNAAKAVRRFANGAMMLELDGVRFTMSHTGRISWACPAGWTRIVGDEKTFPVMESHPVWQPYGPTYGDDEYTYAGPIESL